VNAIVLTRARLQLVTIAHANSNLHSLQCHHALAAHEREEDEMKTRLLATALLLVSGIALADRSPPAAPHLMQIDKLEILLDLDAYQKQEVQKVLETRRSQMQAQRKQMRESQTRPPREQLQQEREAAQQETRAQLAKLLSEQQLKKFEVLTERPQMRKGRRGDKAPQ
jgi:hypothetical protein